MHGGEVAVHIMEHVWSRVLIGQEFLVVEEEQHPPVVASAVDCPTSIDGDMRAVMERHEVFIVGRILGLPRPIPNIFRGDELADYLNGNVMPVVDSYRHRVKLLIGDSDNTLPRGCIGCGYGSKDSTLVFEVVVEDVGIGDCSELGDIEDAGPKRKEGQQHHNS